MHWWSCCVHRWFWKSWEEDEKASGEFRARLWANLTNFTLFGASGTNGRCYRGGGAPLRRSCHAQMVLLCTSLILAVMKGG